MNWFNEPADWNISGNSLTMSVTPKGDYWRISHYGFTVDDAPFYYAEYGGGLGQSENLRRLQGAEPTVGRKHD